MAQNLPRGTPARVLVLLALLVGLTAVSAWRDALRRSSGTWIRHPTALGDTGLFIPGQPPSRLISGGKTILLSAGTATLHRRDDRMFRVSTGFGGDLPFSVFSTRESLDADAEPKLYARISPHQFRRLRVTQEAPGAASAVTLPPASAPLEQPVLKAIPLEEESEYFPEKTPGNGTL